MVIALVILGILNVIAVGLSAYAIYKIMDMNRHLAALVPCVRQMAENQEAIDESISAIGMILTDMATATNDDDMPTYMGMPRNGYH